MEVYNSSQGCLVMGCLELLNRAKANATFMGGKFRKWIRRAKSITFDTENGNLVECEVVLGD